MIMAAADLEGRVAIITGAAMGIGRSCARVMAARGACVFIADIDVEAGEATRREIGAGGGIAYFSRTDVTSFAEFEALARQARERSGRIDILVNSAAQAIGGVVDEIDEMTWNRVMNTNLTSVWRGMKVCVSQMRRQGKGSVINMSSVQALAGFKGWAAYAAAKGGINALTQQAAIDLAPAGIRVNAVAPGTIMTPLNEKVFRVAPEPRSANRILEPGPSDRPLRTTRGSGGTCRLSRVGLCLVHHRGDRSRRQRFGRPRRMRKRVIMKHSFATAQSDCVADWARRSVLRRSVLRAAIAAPGGNCRRSGRLDMARQ
jgi:NAD(P)-dependent dehydrogenase (short-subunit alcohol dehydrogenase family)